MGLTDTPPPHVPGWVVPASTALLGVGVSCWNLTYILMTRRSLQTRSYGMPLFALAFNLSWELVYVFFVTDNTLEFLGFLTWVILDIGLIYTTLRFGPDDWRGTSPFVGRNIGWFLLGMTLIGCWCHYAFVSLWMTPPGLGTGDKTGKWWRGRAGYDTTELSNWSAGVAQLIGSASSLAMLVVRGHSGGTSYAIWASRFIGSVFGLVLCAGFLYWYWPEALSFVFNPFYIFLAGSSIACDLAYPFVLWQVRKTEIELPDGRLIRGDGDRSASEKKAL